MGISWFYRKNEGHTATQPPTAHQVLVGISWFLGKCLLLESTLVGNIWAYA